MRRTWTKNYRSGDDKEKIEIERKCSKEFNKGQKKVRKIKSESENGGG